MQIQKQEGKVFEPSGSRPDAVQFTKDRRNINGKLDSCGIGRAISYIDRCVLVFNPRIMDYSDYDITGEYPCMPRVPLNDGLIVACLTDNPEENRDLLGPLVEGNPGMLFVTPEEWMSQVKELPGGDV